MNNSKAATFWNSYWYGGISAVRPWMLKRVFLLILAFDCWLLLARKGWMYGLGDFNVSHFRWLDAIQPMPSPELYTGMILLTGIMAFVCAFTRSSRILLAGITLFYTYGWAMSRLDDFQHHYMISLILLTFVFFPRIYDSDLYPDNRNVQQAPDKPLKTGAWSYVLLSVNTAIIYFYTVVTKMEYEWRSGKVLESIDVVRRPLFPVESKLVQMDIPLEYFWGAFALSIIVAELFLSASYLLAPLRDRINRTWFRITMWAAFITGLSFHGGLELFDFRIGWFSYYMIAFTCIFLLPESILWKAGRIISYPSLMIDSICRKLAGLGYGKFVIYTLIVATAGFTLLTGAILDLPGAISMSIIAVLVLTVSALYLIQKKYPDHALKYVFTLLIAVSLMWVSVANSKVRFAYYSGLGVFHLRTQQYQAAAEYLDKANTYEKEEDRVKQRERERMVEQLKRQLESGELR